MKHTKKLFINHSIKQEIALVFIAVMAGTIVLCWIISIYRIRKTRSKMRITGSMK